jgi:cell division protein FtsQ
VLVRRWAALSVVLGLALVAAAVWWTPLLGVRSVEVSGERQLTADQVRAAAAVPDGTPMPRLDLRSIQVRVRLLARVATVHVVREWPSTVRIEITERSPIGYLAESDGTHLVDATGLDYATAAHPPHGLPKIQLTDVTPTDQRTEAVVGVLRALPPQLRSLVLAVSARTPGSVTLGLTHGRTVRWGSADDSARKAEVLAPLMTRPGKVYDVSSPELPTVS